MKLPPPCFEFLRCQVVEMGAERAVLRFDPSEEMENPFGLVQGGILAGVVDNVVGMALAGAAPGRRSSTITLTTSFLRAAKVGEPVRAVAEVVKMGRKQAYIEARLEREADGALLLRASATNLFLDGDGGQPG